MAIFTNLFRSTRQANKTNTLRHDGIPPSSSIFLKELLRKPREIGAICASSVYLGDRIAAAINLQAEGYVVELGGGTGALTSCMLRRGLRSDRLIVIEKCPRLAKFLSRRFPSVRILHGDASDASFIKRRNILVSTVVSGLPFRSLPRNMVGAIANAWVQQLHHHGRVIQFTYVPFRAEAWLNAGLIRTCSETVWANFPPARVEIFAP